MEDVTIMDSSTPQSRFRRAKGLRTGVVIGVALALVGAVVGTATGAVTPFQQVLVVNAPASPIPITGTVSVSNTPANQNVTVTNTTSAAVPVQVTNLPATQPVSGTVNVGNLPAVQVANKHYREIEDVESETLGEFSFGRTINVSTLIISNTENDGLIVSLWAVGSVGIYPTIYMGDGGTTQNFATPIPATGMSIWCANLVLDCTVRIAAFGT